MLTLPPRHLEKHGKARQKTIYVVVSGVFMTLGGLPSFAADLNDVMGEEKELREVEVTATRTGGAVEDSPRSVSLVDAATLSERPAASGLQSVLAETPGIQFSRSGGLGGQIVMRGFNSNSQRSILTVDGDRYLGRSTLEFNMFDADGVERVEVIRGAASALYGSDAMNGVVNIVTRRAKIDPNRDFELTPHLRSLGIASNNNMVGARAELEGGGNGFDLLIGLSGRTAEDFDTPLGRAEHSRYQSYGLDFNVGYSPKDSAHQSRYELSGRYQHVDTERAGGLGAAPGYPKRLLREEPIVEQYLRLGYQGKNYGVFADTLDVSVYRRHFETDIYQTNRTSPASTANVHLKVYTPLVWGGHLTALKNVGDHLIGYGADFLHERNKGRRQEDDVTNNATGVTTHRPWRAVDRTRQQTDIGVFVTDEWKTAERLTLSGALRFDWVKATIGKEPAAGENAAITAAFGDHPGVTRTAVTGNVGAVFKLTPVWDLTANVSRGFRAPAGEMTTTGTAGAINNLPAPDLNPEYSKSLEVGTRWHSDAHFGSLVGYLTRYTDLIVSTRIDSNNFQRKNIGKAEIAGIELEGFWQFASSWQLRYMATYTRGTDKSSDVPLDYIAPLVGRLALRYDRETWYGEGVWRGYKGKTRIDPSKERTSGSYSMIDLYAGAKLDRFGSAWRGWKVIAGIENVFDRVGRNPTVYEDIAFARNVTNPLVEPGRNFVLKIVSEY